VRGKNIIWISIMAMLLGALTMVPSGKSQDATALSLTPSMLPEDGTFGHVGDQYTLTVNIANAADLWALQFRIAFAPYTSVLGISNLQEGPFLCEDIDGPGPELPFWPTFFTYTIDAFHGYADVAIVRLPNPEFPGEKYGAWGDGELATFNMNVVEAGTSPVALENVILLDTTGAETPSTATGSYYTGSSATLLRLVGVGMGYDDTPTKRAYVGQTFHWNQKVINEGDVPLYVRVRFDITREEDGRYIRLYSGQTYLDGAFGEDPSTTDEIYVNGFTGTYGAGWGWNYVGTAPYLNAVNDGNYVWSDWGDYVYPMVDSPSIIGTGTWTDPGNATESDGNYTTTSTDGALQEYSGYDFDTETLELTELYRVEVGLEAKTDTGGDDQILLSVYNGTMWSDATALDITNNATELVWIDVTESLDWNATLMDTTEVRVEYNQSGTDATPIYVDWLPVRVTPLNPSLLPGFYPYTGKYEFEDYAIPEGRSISSVVLQAYTRYSTPDEDMDLDTYMRDAAEAPPSTWIGSLWGNVLYEWVSPRWVTDDLTVFIPDLATQTGINAAKVRFIMYWTGDDLPHQTAWIDAMRMQVNTVPARWGVEGEIAAKRIDPGKEVAMHHATFYSPLLSQVGTYHVTATIEYTYAFLRWNSYGSPQRAFTFTVSP